MAEPGQGELADIGLYFERVGLPALRLSEREREYFRDKDVQNRIIEGAERAAKQAAESSFTIGTLRGKKTVFPLVYGSDFAEFQPGMTISSQLGSNTSAEVATNPEIEAINEILKKREGRKFIPFDEIDEFPIDVDANFHFHPDTSGFSSKDVANYDVYWTPKFRQWCKMVNLWETIHHEGFILPSLRPRLQ